MRAKSFSRPQHQGESASVFASIALRAGGDIIGKAIEMHDERGCVREFFELAAIQSRNAKMRGGAERLQFCGFLDFTVFDQTEPFPHDFAGVLITSALPPMPRLRSLGVRSGQHCVLASSYLHYDDISMFMAYYANSLDVAAHATSGVASKSAS